MNNLFENAKTEADENIARNALIGAILVGSFGLLLVLFALFLRKFGQWQDYFLVGVSALLMILGFGCVPLLKRGLINLGTGITFMANLLIPIAATLTQEGFGWVSMIYVAISSSLIILLMLPRSARKRAMIVATVVLLLLLAVELIDPAFRMERVSEMLGAVITNTTILIVAFVLLTSSRTWGGEEQIDPRMSWWYALIIVISGMVLNGFGIYLIANGMRDWQFLVPFLLTIAYTLAGFSSLFLNQRAYELGILERGVSLLFFFNLLPPLAAGILIKGLGFLAGVYILTCSVFAIFEVLSRQTRLWAALTALGAIVCAVMPVWIAPPFQMVVPEALDFTPYAIGLLLVFLVALLVRRAMFGNIRLKLVVSFVAVTVMVVLALSVASTSILRSSVTEQINDVYDQEVLKLSQLVSAFFEVKVTQVVTLSVTDLLKEIVEERNESYTGDQATILSEIQALDAQWVAASDDDPQIQSVISADPAVNPVTFQLKDYLEAFPNLAEIFVTDRYGATVGASGRLSDYYQADEGWWLAAWNDGEGAIYISDPQYDESAGVFASQVAVPIVSEETDEILGIARATLVLEELYEIINSVQYGETGYAVLFGKDANVIYEPPGYESSVDLEADLRRHFVKMTHFMLAADADGDQTFFAHTPIYSPLEADHPVEAAIKQAIDNLGWAVVIRQDVSEVYSIVDQTTRTFMIFAVIGVVLSAAVAAALSQALVRPILQLSQVAEKFAAGDLSARAEVRTQDEVGTLSQTYNDMAAQMRELLGTLEQRVVYRTRALEISTEVGRRLSTILDQDELVVEVVEQVQRAFDYYHVHIYLFDEAKENLRMVGGTGEAGGTMLERGHSIEKGKGLVGRAGERDLVVLVPDVSIDPDWLPNPLLPETISEIAVPIAVGDEVLGVLDVQDDQDGGLRQTDADLLQSIAAQVAIALQNAQAYHSAQRQAERETLISEIGGRIQGTTSVEDALKVSVRELSRALGKDTFAQIMPEKE